MAIKDNYIEFRNALSKGDSKSAEEAFRKAYNEAFIYYQNKLAENKKFDLSNEDERYALITLTDNLLGYWAEGMFDEGIAFAESMIDLVDSPKLKEMFKGYSLGMQSGIPLNDFMKEYMDLSKVDSEFPEFLCNFKEKIKELVSEGAS